MKVYDPVFEIQVLRVDLIFWLKSSITRKIEETPRKLTKNNHLNVK
ncbi:hypothetical protein THALO_70075 [Tenacibaculum halocynthiae]